MIQAEYNVDVIRGDTYNGVEFTYLVNSVPVDLTNADIKIEFRYSSKTGRLTKTIEVGNGITITDAVNGVFRINAFVVLLDVGRHYYDIQLTLNGEIKTYVEGVFTVLQDVTKNV